ncbi:MAG: hypothetical protein QOF83_4221 [Solirubrobacteraceae bacterium]|nr:hypothetical protein [Solirubrobacteraceae bacterium]
MAVVQIRRARASDAPELAALVQRAYGHYPPRIGRRPAPMDDDYTQRIARDWVMVADDGSPVGVLVMVLCTGE